jgi:RNA recognition motif-containing protein
MGRKLFVGNLPFDTTEAQLQELFERAGKVETVNVMRDMATGRPRGFAFVEMSSDDEARKAIDELHESQLGGRTLTVNEARPKPQFGGGPRSGGGQGRGGRGGGRRDFGGGGRSEPRW